MSSELCSFHAIVIGDCEASRGLETLFLLRDCNDDIGGHLVNCDLSAESMTETDLILTRAGLFSVTESQIVIMSICARHRHSLGKFWRPPRSFQYPDHKGKSTAEGGRPVISLKLARENPDIASVCLRSDGAGRYHNNSLIASVTHTGERIGVRILRNDYSQPQHGKDVCDCILRPMKASIRRHCNKGHDILSADDMDSALSERYVRGTSACVCLTEVS